MNLAAKLRGRNSPQIFTRSKKPTVVTKNTAKAVAHFNSSTVNTTPNNELGEKSVVENDFEHEEVIDAFPNIYVDARQDDDDDSVSIQTEQRDDIVSIESIQTEYDEPQEEFIDTNADATIDAEVPEEHSPCPSITEEQVEFADHSAGGCRASCAVGPHMEKSMAVMKEYKQAISQKFEEARPGLEQRASEMKSSIASASAKAASASAVAGASLAAGAVVVGAKAGKSIVDVSTQAGGMAQRFVCGDERALQYHAKNQEQIASPKQEVTSHVAGTDVKSPTHAALAKYSLNRLICGSYKFSDCVHDMAVGTVDIVCLGYCDCTKDNAKTDSGGENDDLSEVLSPTSPDMCGDSTTRAFTFDSFDSCDSTHYTEGTNPSINLSLAKAASIAENRLLMLQSIELTEGDFRRTISSCDNAAPTNSKSKKFMPFSTKSSRDRRSPFSPPADSVKTVFKVRASPVPVTNSNSIKENVAIELVDQALNTKPQTTRRKPFFRREKKADNKIHAVVEDNSNSASGSQKTGSTGCSTAQIKNTMALTLSKTKKRSHEAGSLDKASAEDGQQSMYSL